jgi:hypothetical protein
MQHTQSRAYGMQHRADNRSIDPVAENDGIGMHGNKFNPIVFDLFRFDSISIFLRDR